MLNEYERYFLQISRWRSTNKKRSEKFKKIVGSTFFNHSKTFTTDELNTSDFRNSELARRLYSATGTTFLGQIETALRHLKDGQNQKHDLDIQLFFLAVVDVEFFEILVGVSQQLVPAKEKRVRKNPSDQLLDDMKISRLQYQFKDGSYRRLAGEPVASMDGPYWGLKFLKSTAPVSDRCSFRLYEGQRASSGADLELYLQLSAHSKIGDDGLRFGFSELSFSIDIDQKNSGEFPFNNQLEKSHDIGGNGTIKLVGSNWIARLVLSATNAYLDGRYDLAEIGYYCLLPATDTPFWFQAILAFNKREKFLVREGGTEAISTTKERLLSILDNERFADAMYSEEWCILATTDYSVEPYSTPSGYQS